MGSIELRSTAGGLVVAPSLATGGHLTQSDWGSQYRVPLRVKLYTFFPSC